MAVLYCNFCRGIRPATATHCLGCGAPLARTKQPQQPKGAGRPPCPACRRTRSREIEPDRYECRDCGAVFERDDFGYLDDRPDVNAEKRERCHG